MIDKRKTILKLKEIVLSGYIPERGNEMYNAKLSNGSKTKNIANCFSHACFNLTDNLFEKYDFTNHDGKVFGKFSILSFFSKKILEHESKSFIKKTGLQIKQYDGKKKLKNNQWVVALYFEKLAPIPFYCDIHWLKMEKDGKWSGKNGFQNTVEIFDEKPKNTLFYDYYKTYVITNPYAKER